MERAAEAEAGADAIGASGEIFRREAKRERRSEEGAEERFNGMSPWGGTAVEVEMGAARFMRPPSRSVE